MKPQMEVAVEQIFEMYESQLLLKNSRYLFADRNPLNFDKFDVSAEPNKFMEDFVNSADFQYCNRL